MNRDPLSTYALWNLGTTYYLAGRIGDSERTYRRLLELEPDFLWTRKYLAKALLAQGKSEAALTAAQDDVDEPNRLKLLPVFLHAAGKTVDADAALHAQITQWGSTGAYYVAQSYAYRGDHDRTMEWLERAYMQRDVALPEIFGEPFFKNISTDPRFIAFLKKMNLPTEPVPVNWQ